MGVDSVARVLVEFLSSDFWLFLRRYCWIWGGIIQVGGEQVTRAEWGMAAADAESYLCRDRSKEAKFCSLEERFF